MKKIEKFKIQVQLLLIVLISIYPVCKILNIIKGAFLGLPVPVLIIIFCWIIYKVFKNI